MRCIVPQCNAAAMRSAVVKDLSFRRAMRRGICISLCHRKHELSNARLNSEFSLQDVYILSAVRTPIGKFGGSLASMTAADMGVVAAKAAMERAGVQPGRIDETIFGNARQA